MSDRIRKINELIREQASFAISEIIGKENFITVTAIETARDLKNATIWVSLFTDAEKGMAELNSHKSEIQHYITSKMATKYTPKIEFKLDHSPEYVDKIERLLNE